MTATPTDHYVEVNGLTIHYLDWGGDSPRNLLLVHGQGGNAHNWDHIARELRDEFRVIALDQRGHGDSSHTRDGYAVTAFASDLAAFAEAIGIVPCDYVGASLGARNAIPYAGDNPTHLKHLVCLDYGPEMSVASARNQIGGMNRRPLGYRSIDEYVEMSMQANPRPSADYYRTTAEHGLRLNYAGSTSPSRTPTSSGSTAASAPTKSPCYGRSGRRSAAPSSNSRAPKATSSPRKSWRACASCSRPCSSSKSPSPATPSHPTTQTSCSPSSRRFFVD